MRLSLTLLFLCFALPAQAACYADYKAKKDNPLQLQYGVSAIPDDACTPVAATAYLAPRLASGGWQLLTVLSVFDASGLAERQDDAGQYFLRY